jgi:bifunctional ADP-heptose synthase (sugar kinase/adenylyltransferase)
LSKLTRFDSAEDITDFLKTPENAPKALVFGDPMHDVYWECELNGFSEEAAIPKLKVKDDGQFYLPGGAANVMANLCRLGVDAYMVYPEEGERPEKHRIMVGNRQICRFDFNDKCEPIIPKAVKVVFKEYRPAAVIISDYYKGALDKNAITAITKELDAKPDVKLFVDTKRDPAIFPDNGTFFPNLKEFQQYEASYRAKDTVVLKRGEEGLQILNEGDLVSDYNGVPIPEVSVNGAGDSVLSAYVRAILYNHPNPGYYANLGGAAAVMCPYTTLVDHAHISELHRRYEAYEEL